MKSSKRSNTKDKVFTFDSKETKKKAKRQAKGLALQVDGFTNFREKTQAFRKKKKPGLPNSIVQKKETRNQRGQIISGSYKVAVSA